LALAELARRACACKVIQEYLLPSIVVREVQLVLESMLLIEASASRWNAAQLSARVANAQELP